MAPKRLIELGETVTDEQIRALRVEAGAAGDDLMVDICTIALDESPSLAEPAPYHPENRSALEALGIIPEHIDAGIYARAECARVIAEAAAQR